MQHLGSLCPEPLYSASGSHGGLEQGVLSPGPSKRAGGGAVVNPGSQHPDLRWPPKWLCLNNKGVSLPYLWLQVPRNPKPEVWIKVVLHCSGLSVHQFSHSVMSNSLRPHESQHARPPCPSPRPGVYSNSCPLSR